MIDALRGFSLLGILIVHSVHVFLTVHHGQLPAVRWAPVLVWGVNTLIDGKFYPIFAMLFGLSFAIQQRQALLRKQLFAGRFLWRMALLLGIGWLHLYLYTGEILHLYAPVGVLLVAVRRQRSRWVLQLAGVLFVASVAATCYAATKDNLVAGIYGQRLYGHTLLIAALFMLGLYLGRQGAFADTPRNAAWFTRVLGAALGAFAVVRIGGDWALGHVARSAQPIVTGATGEVKSVLLSAAYISAVFLLHRWAHARLGWLAAIGRVGLSAYVAQSFFLWFIYSYLDEQMPLPQALAATALFYMMQVLVAGWWMRYFRAGPLEWAWRSATYFKWQPLRR